MSAMRPFLLLISAVVLASCGKLYRYERFYDIPMEGWGSDGPLYYSYFNDDTVSVVDIDMVVVTERLPLDDTLHVFFDINTPDGMVASRDYTLPLNGDPGPGGEHTVRLVESARFRRCGNYLMTLRCYGSTVNIKAVGVIIR